MDNCVLVGDLCNEAGRRYARSAGGSKPELVLATGMIWYRYNLKELNGQEYSLVIFPHNCIIEYWYYTEDGAELDGCDSLVDVVTGQHPVLIATPLSWSTQPPHIKYKVKALEYFFDIYCFLK